LKLIDFGSSKHFIDGLPTAERLGSAYYIAPEVLAGHYDQKCDVWSLGVILHILLSGFPPFAGNNDYEIFHNIQYSEVSFTDRCWSKVSKEAVDLIKIMLQKNPLDRPTAAWVFQSPWLQKFRKNLLPDALFSSATLSNLSQFSVSSKLMKASLNFIAKHLMTGDEVENIRKLFEKIDKNGDGILNSEEIQEALKNCPGDLLLNVENIMKKVQEDTDGGIRYSEFLTAAIDWDKELSRDRLKKAFMEFDKDGNGSISIDELMKTLGGQQEQAHIFIQMMKEADFDGNGEIDLEEFCTFMLQRKYIKSL
jgi:calcium-dependent protein kinase